MAIATNYFTDLYKLREWLAQGVQKATSQNQSVLVSYSYPVAAVDPLDFFTRANATGQAAFFWERADDRFGLAGAGTAFKLQGQGQSRFDQIEKQWQDLLAEALIYREGIEGDLWGIGPSLVGGFAFDTARPSTGRWQSYPDGLMRLPRIQLISRADGHYLTLNTMVQASTDPQTAAEELTRLCALLCQPPASNHQPATTSQQPPASNHLEDVMPANDWKALVAKVSGLIKAGQFQKVVLAREVRAQAGQPLDISQALGRLRVNYPSATLFAVAQAGRCFLAATPERLVRLYEGEVRTIGLAGTFPRGKTEEEDRELGQELLNSSKNREEHAVVVRMLRTALSKVCRYVWAEENPTLLKLSNVQHLYTPVLGRLAEDARISILKLVEQLHPTPALGGFPRAEALAWLRGNEGLDRGWYAAPIGWVDCRGEGEFVVAIRSALVEGNQAYLYAGCGIMADSDPESEYIESCLKLKPMLTALGL
jgi:isochorismate synthase